jgi:single-strand DNA-binding protein
MNCSILIGRLARDPELRRTGTGKAVTSFTIAVDNFGKDSGASFIPCVAWEQKGEFVNNYFTKGSQIAVRGRLQSRQYETKDGKKQTAIEVVVDEVSFCGKKEDKGDGYSGGEHTYQQNNFTPIEDVDNELPF